jgi:large subunit ribosomal protein L7Ae
MNQVEVPKELIEKIYKLIESVKIDGRIRKGTNEATKSLEKGEAKLVVSAGDVSPKEIVMHMPVIAKEKSIPFVEVPSKSELGAAAGLPVGTSAIAIVNEGDAKKQLFAVLKDLENLQKASEKGSEPKEEKKVEEKKPEAPKVEEKKEKPAEEAKTEEPKVEEKTEEVKKEQPKEEKVEESKPEEPKADEKPAEETPAEPKIAEEKK